MKRFLSAALFQSFVYGEGGDPDNGDAPVSYLQVSQLPTGLVVDDGQIVIPSQGYLTAAGLDHWLYNGSTTDPPTLAKYLEVSQLPTDYVVDTGQLNDVVVRTI